MGRHLGYKKVEVGEVYIGIENEGYYKKYILVKKKIGGSEVEGDVKICREGGDTIYEDKTIHIDVQRFVLVAKKEKERFEAELIEYKLTK